MSDKPSYASVITNRGFRFLWFNQIMVQLAYNTLNFTLIIWVFKLTNSNFAVSLLMLSIYLPSVIFGIFAGVFVDRADRRRVILLVDFCLALAFFWFIFVKGSYFLILLNAFIVNSLSQFFIPAESSSIPLLVPKKLLFIANSLFSLTLYASFMIGFTMGGPILSSFGINALFITGAGILITAFLLARNLPKITTPGPREDNSKLMTLEGIRKLVRLTFKEGSQTFGFIRGRLNIVSAIALMSTIQGMIAVMAVTMPSYLERVLHIHATDSSYFMMLPLGLGMISGALIVGRLFYGRPKRSLVLPAVLAGGALLILVGLLPGLAALVHSPDLPLYLARPRYFTRALNLASLFAVISYIAGFCAVSVIVPCQTLIQENTTEKNRGKIFSTMAVIMTATSAVAALFAGALSDIFGVAQFMAVLGIIVTIVAVLAIWPHLFFPRKYLPVKIREFLGVGHWEENKAGNGLTI